MMGYWLAKTEPETYSIDDLETAGTDMWDGVRNFQARSYLKDMRRDDPIFIYHTGKNKEIVGIGKMVRGAYPDPTSDDKEQMWYAIDIQFVKKFKQPVSLAEIKKN